MGENFDEFDKWLAFHHSFPFPLLNAFPMKPTINLSNQSFVCTPFVKVLPRQILQCINDWP